MEITTVTLMLYFAAWTFFYFAISHYIARLSKDKWVDWAKSVESDEDLLIILDPIVNEIEDRMHEKLEAFQASFYGSLGAASKKIDEATGQSTIKAITKESPIMGFVADLLMKRNGLEGLLKGQNSPEQGSNKPQTGPKLGLGRV
tara:strand:- start:149 stop:583 length:435 start_codon:yes stop_codon:yes gene_type:complete